MYKMILFTGILAVAVSCGSAGLPETDLPEEAVGFQFTDGTSMSSNTADEHHPVMLGNHFYYVSDVGVDSFVHHAVLQSDGKFQNLGRLKDPAGSADVNLKDLGTYQTNECQIGTGNNDYWDMHGVTMQDGQSFLIFGRRIKPANDDANGICVAPLNGSGAIDWSGVKLYLLGNDTGSECARPIAVGFMVTDDGHLGVFQNFGGRTASAGITFQKLAYNTATKSIVSTVNTTTCSISGKKMPTKLIPLPVPVLNYPPGAFALEVRHVHVQKYGVDFQILNNNGRLQLLGEFGSTPLVLDIFDPVYYEKCSINSPSIGPDKRFYFAAKCQNPQFPTQDLYRINYPTVDEMGPARKIIRYILTGEKPELGIPLP